MKRLLLLFTILFLSGCQYNSSNSTLKVYSKDISGKWYDENPLDSLKVGSDTIETVRKKMGSPTFFRQFTIQESADINKDLAEGKIKNASGKILTGQMYYYVTENTKSILFVEDIKVDRTIYKLYFSEKGILFDVKVFEGPVPSGNEARSVVYKINEPNLKWMLKRSQRT